MTKHLNPLDDFNPSPILADAVELEAIHMHLAKVHEILDHIYTRHSGTLSGVSLAAKASVEADLRAADDDVDRVARYLGREAAA